MNKREAVPFTTHQTKYLKFVVMRFKPKTMVIAVVSKSSDEELGRIEWYCAWRQYCFMPYGNTIWNNNCLIDVQNFITALMIKHRPKPKTIGVICKDMWDFQNWSRQKKHKKKPNHTVRKYVSGITAYISLTLPHHSKGYHLDKIIETDAAHLNSKYHQIMEQSKSCLINKK